MSEIEAFPAIRPGARVLFQGDSITDACRNRDVLDANLGFGLGGGYVMVIAAHLLGKLPRRELHLFNRGVSGDKVSQLIDRWDRDTLELAPDILTILVGVNDFWHITKHGYPGSVERYREDYRRLLHRTREALPGTLLVIGEPFALSGGTEIDESWYPEFDGYRAAARTVASEFDAVWIPFQKIFANAAVAAPVKHWCPDGVHPSAAGAWIMAEAWLHALSALSRRK